MYSEPLTSSLRQHYAGTSMFVILYIMIVSLEIYFIGMTDIHRVFVNQYSFMNVSLVCNIIDYIRSNTFVVFIFDIIYFVIDDQNTRETLSFIQNKYIIGVNGAFSLQRQIPASWIKILVSAKARHGKPFHDGWCLCPPAHTL